MYYMHSSMDHALHAFIHETLRSLHKAYKWGRIIKRQMPFEEEKEYIVLQLKWKPKSPPASSSPRQSQAQQSMMVCSTLFTITP